MYIIAGEKKGHKLIVPEYEFRPTQGKVREALFNILHVDGMTALDLCAGSGSIGLEALSRGAADVTFVDRNPRSIRAIQESLTKLGYRAQAVVADAKKFLARAEKKYDLIYIDPPYQDGLYQELYDLVRTRQLLAPEGTLVLEMNTRDKKLPSFQEQAAQVRHYGKSVLAFFS